MRRSLFHEWFFWTYMFAYTHMNFTHYPTDTNDIYLVDMSRERQRPFSELAEKWINKYLREGKHIAVITNKKWRSTWIICETCWDIPKCTNCDISITRHKDSHDEYFWLCHICKSHYPYMTTCQACPHTAAYTGEVWEMTLYGIWIQQLTMLIQDTRGISPYIITSKDVNSPSKLTKARAELSHSTPQILLGTSLLTTPPSLRGDLTIDMVIVLEADGWLHTPHFSASRNNFCFLSEIITWYPKAQLIFQSYNVETPSVLHACNQDMAAMQTFDLARRKEHLYPPYGEICALLYKHEIEKNVHWSTDKLYKELLYLREKYEWTDLEIYPTPPLVYKMFGKFRYTIILKSATLRQFMEIAWSRLDVHKRWFKMDWEPRGL